MAANQSIRVLTATQSEEVYARLNERDDIHYDIALYTGSIKDLLPQAQLIIVDYGDLVEYPLTEVELREAILAAQVLECSSEEFLANPDRYFDELVANRPGRMRSLPQHYCIAFVSYSGGTGRTTLALDTALHHAEVQRRGLGRREGRTATGREASQTMLLELTFGSSALVSITGVELPRLYSLATSSDALPQQYKGVTMLPMDYENVRVLSEDYLGRYVTRQVQQHALTVIDAIWPHSLAGAVTSLVDLWLVVANERPDTIANAKRLCDELRADFGAERVWLVQNRVSNGKKSRAEAREADWHLRLQRINAPEDWRGELGGSILSQVFAPVWAEAARGRKPGSQG
ncbi:MAG: hypothetical protein V1772_01685 [Chloroflexota bacterium]